MIDENNEFKHIKIIKIKCPECGEKGELKLPEELFEKYKYKPVKVQITPGMICNDHTYIALINAKGIVIGYEKINISIGEGEDKEITDKKEYDKFNLKKVIDFYGFYGLINLLHSKLYNYPTYIINYKNIKINIQALNSFFEELIPKSFKNISSIKLLDKSNYKDVTSKEQSLLLIDSRNNSMQIPWDYELKFEKDIFKKALKMKGETMRIKVIKSELSDFTNIIEEIINFVNKKKKEKLSENEFQKIAKKKMKKKYFPQIKQYLMNQGILNQF